MYSKTQHFLYNNGVYNLTRPKSENKTRQSGPSRKLGPFFLWRCCHFQAKTPEVDGVPGATLKTTHYKHINLLTYQDQRKEKKAFSKTQRVGITIKQAISKARVSQAVNCQTECVDRNEYDTSTLTYILFLVICVNSRYDVSKPIVKACYWC